MSELNNYNYMKMLCSKLSRNQIIEDLATKCEELYLVRTKYEKLEMKNIKLHSIIKEALNYIDDNTYYKDHKGNINIDDLYIILQKGIDKE